MIAGLLLLLLVALAATSDRTGARGAVGLAVVSVLWLVFNGPMEGAVLLSFGRAHGLTVADLVGLLGLGIAGCRFASTPEGARWLGKLRRRRAIAVLVARTKGLVARARRRLR